jgi:hypothetical protein
MFMIIPILLLLNRPYDLLFQIGRTEGYWIANCEKAQDTASKSRLHNFIREPYSLLHYTHTDPINMINDTAPTPIHRSYIWNRNRFIAPDDILVLMVTCRCQHPRVLDNEGQGVCSDIYCYCCKFIRSSD